MSDEHIQPPGPSENNKPDERVDVPVPRAQPRPGEPTYSEKQVAQILQRTAQLERGRAQAKPELSLAEVEAIAREAGLDPSLVRIAAQSLEAKADEPSLGARIAGAPLRRVFERVIDGELTQAAHEQISNDLRAAFRDDTWRSGARWDRSAAGRISTVGRTLTMSTGLIEIEVLPRGDKTLLRIDVSCGQLAGGFFGGFGGAFGGGTTPLIIGLSANAHLAGPEIALAAAGYLGLVYFVARSLYTWRANKAYQRMEKLADQLSQQIGEELAAKK